MRMTFEKRYALLRVLFIEIVKNGSQLAIRHDAVIVSNIVKQVHDIAVFLLFVASDNKAKALSRS